MNNNKNVLFISGPLASIMTNRFGHRNIVMLGGILTTIGMCISAYATDIYFLYFSYGVITGKITSQLVQIGLSR